VLYAFGIFSKEGHLAAMPFVFFLMGMALLYIANSYHAEHTIRQIDRTAKELKLLRTEYISGKSELMFTSKQSHVALMSLPLGLKESQDAPLKIVVRDEKSDNTSHSIWGKLKKIFS
jgi:hypothetical protein